MMSFLNIRCSAQLAKWQIYHRNQVHHEYWGDSQCLSTGVRANNGNNFRQILVCLAQRSDCAID